MQTFDQVGSSLQRQGQRNPLSWALVETGRYEEAETQIEEALTVAHEVGYARQGKVMAGITRAYLSLERQDTEAMCRHLQETLSEALAHGQECWLQWHRSWMPELCREALRHQIEPDYVRRLIRSYRWPPPDVTLESWPWPIRVWTLGNFSVEINGEPLAFGRKVPRKVLALLKAIIAYGTVNVSQQKVLDALWPDEEGDDAQTALTAALRRLRSLLAHPEAVVHAGKELSIDETLCWIDLRAFERTLQSTADTAALGDAAALFYRGGFLAADHEFAWAVPMRERLRSRFIHIVETTGRVLEQRGRFEEALERYRSGLQADDLVEGFYMGQMRCHLALDRPAEASGIYRRMQHIFSVVLGIQPCKDSMGLRDQALVRQGGRAMKEA